jgi:hypothetical protein
MIKPYLSVLEFMSAAEDDNRVNLLIKLVDEIYKSNLAAMNSEQRVGLLRKFKIIVNVGEDEDFLFNRYPQGTFGTVSIDKKSMPEASYIKAIKVNIENYSNLIYRISKEQDEEKRLIHEFDLSLIEHVWESNNININSLDVYQSDKQKSLKPIHASITVTNCYVDELYLVLSSESKFCMINSNNIIPTSHIRLDIFQNSNVIIENCKISNISLVAATRSGGDINLIKTEINNLVFTGSRLDSISINNCRCEMIKGSGEVTRKLLISEKTEIERFSLEDASIPSIAIQSSFVSWGYFPSNGQLKHLDIKSTKLGYDEDGFLNLIARTTSNKINSLELHDVDIHSPLKIHGWEIKATSIQNVRLHNALDFTGTSFLSEPNVGDINLGYIKNNSNNDVLLYDNIEAGLRPLIRSMEAYGNFNSAYRLKRLEAILFGIRPISEVGFFSWLANYVYKSFSNYGISINRPPIFFLTILLLFVILAGFSLIFLDGWVYTGSLSDFLEVTRWLVESYLKATPIGITFEASNPEWVVSAPNTKGLVQFFSIIFGCASYILFFLFFLAVRRRYQL